MRIGRICRLCTSLRLKNPAVWLGAIAFASGAAFAQAPPGAFAAATGAAAAATVAAQAPRKIAASAALDAAAMGSNSALAQAKTDAPGTPSTAEEATNNAAPASESAAPDAAAPPLQGVAAQCANLLKLATNLKTEVDKTTKDVLSVSVIRDAGQIEDLAKKMRGQQR